MAKLLLIFASLAFCNAEMGRQRRWRLERRKKAAAAAAAARREREKNAPRDAESTSDGAIGRPARLERRGQITKLRHDAAAAVVPRSKRLGWRRGGALERRRRRIGAFCS
jgi:hypothetical protein